jgi:raw
VFFYSGDGELMVAIATAQTPRATPQVFLGGTCGATTWRQKIAIPALEAAQITYYNPQLGIGEWTESCEVLEQVAKAEAEVLLFNVGGEARGVASLAEVAYLLAANRPLALVIDLIPEQAWVEGHPVTAMERRDLNRGRIYVRSMAAQHGVPVFTRVAEAVDYAIALIYPPSLPAPLIHSHPRSSARVSG